MKVLFVLALVAAASALPRVSRKVPGGGKIVGGVPATQGELPYQLSLQTASGSHFCGATLIANDLAMSAAHCLQGDTPNSIRLVAGELNRNVNSGREQILRASRIVIHQDYEAVVDFENDIALIFLANEAVFNEDVAAIKLPAQNAQTTGNIKVSGWGTTSSGGSLPAVLQHVDIPVVDDATCGRNYPQETILENMLCAGLTEGGKDSCQGDSGGPLVSVDPASPTNGAVVGIVSWGYGCAVAGKPGVNTEVSYFVDWIAAQRA